MDMDRHLRSYSGTMMRCVTFKMYLCNKRWSSKQRILNVHACALAVHQGAMKAVTASSIPMPLGECSH